MRPVLVTTLLACLALGVGAQSAQAHRNGCHTKHVCPSDHATYRWSAKKLLCVKPTSDKRSASFKIRVRHDGLTYFCKR